MKSVFFLDTPLGHPLLRFSVTVGEKRESFIDMSVSTTEVLFTTEVSITESSSPDAEIIGIRKP